jgi:hypothetical protein
MKKPTAKAIQPKPSGKGSVYVVPKENRLEERASHLVKQGFSLTKIELPPKKPAKS